MKNILLLLLSFLFFSCTDNSKRLSELEDSIYIEKIKSKNANSLDSVNLVSVDSVFVPESFTPEQKYSREMAEIIATRDIVIDAKKHMETSGIVDKPLALFLDAQLEKQNTLLSLQKYQNIKADRELYFRLYSEKETEFYKQYPHLK